MKLISYERGGERRIGVAVGQSNRVLDLRAAVASVFVQDGDLRAQERAALEVPSDMTQFLSGGPTALEKARRAVEWANAHPGETITLDRKEVRLLAPVPRPPKVFGIGGNYPELKKTWPTPPDIPPTFQRASSSIVGPEDDVVLPADVKYMQPEMEICVVIGQRCRNVAEEDAYAVIAGYTIGNDISDVDVLMTKWVTRKRPDLAEYGLPTEAPYNLGLAFQSKSWDTTAPTGPYLVTTDELDPNDLEFEFRVNGEVRQSGSSSEMLVKIPEMIAYLSRVATLGPGDVIFTGARGHLGPLHVGDVMDHKITGLGSFTTKCVAEPAT